MADPSSRAVAAAGRAAARRGAPGDTLARAAERVLRVLGDGRTGLVLLVAVGAVNAVAAILPGGPGLLDAPPYAFLLGALALSGLAAMAVRAPAAWREWRRPTAVQSGAETLTATLDAMPLDTVADRLRRAGYRVRVEVGPGRARPRAVHGVRNGASRFAALLSHLAVLVVVLGAAIGAAFGSETVFSLLPGEQALLDEPRDGFSAALRLESLDAEFTPDGRPLRLDTTVRFVDAGEAGPPAVLRVNEPGEFGGYLVHPWTYGPAATLRVTSLGGSVLLDGHVPLDEERDGVPTGAAELPTLGATLGLALTDAEANELGISLVGSSGLVETVRLRPGDRARVGDLTVEVRGFDAWVTFLSRRDPGLLVLFGGATALALSLAVAFWLPRRRVTVRPIAASARLQLHLRGERLDRPGDELARLTRLLGAP